ncbi:UV radiation resistance protein and autophagy-related subunit 14-domain-containing protein [Lineolata rhizophorae]|uniref:Autophagy-related protein 14 n=1 Tax=Lineolata rhizophorae TaxID=578093 RepID=A0A6A6NMM6_9PEZI|nr:UV radiation resistance protein and autophagy-related subunit 14-domain-containing protein [Lineolata rhizophorae]
MGDDAEFPLHQELPGGGRRERPWLYPYNRRLRHLQGITIRNLTLLPSQSTPHRSRGHTIDDDALPYTLTTPAKALALRESKKLEHSRSSSDLGSMAERSSGGKSKLESKGKVQGKGKGAASTSSQGLQDGYSGGVTAVESAPAEPGARDGAEQGSGMDGGGDSSGGTPKPTTPPRPTFTKMRRRSTMEWANASPLSRQKKLEDVTSGRMADVFFSLHVDGMDQPVYVSEVAPKAMNPSFRFFDLGPCGPSVTRRDELTVKVWTKTETMDGWQYLVDLSVNLRALQFIGKELPLFRHPLPQNCILFHLTDGIYTSFTDLPISASLERSITDPLNNTSAARGGEGGRDLPTVPTSSYDALMRLSTLDTCIQDALATRDHLASQLATLVSDNAEALSLTQRAVAEADDSAKTVLDAVTHERRRVETVRRRRNELRARNAGRREAMRKGIEAQQLVAEAMEEGWAKARDGEKAMERVEEEMVGQRRRVCEELLQIYPVEPLAAAKGAGRSGSVGGAGAGDSRPSSRGSGTSRGGNATGSSGDALAFTIRGLHLPNANLDDADPDVVAAALGHVAQCVHALSFYLSAPLPYPLTPHGSTSLIYDPISLTPSTSSRPATSAAATSGSGAATAAASRDAASRTYPLFARGALSYRFQYAVFLLNKDVDVLATRLGLRLPNIAWTLPNLKYVLFVATAGKGEVPARKAGGIRGLLARGREARSLLVGEVERRGSGGSEGSPLGAGRAAGNLGNALAGAVGRLSPGAAREPGTGRAPSAESGSAVAITSARPQDTNGSGNGSADGELVRSGSARRSKDRAPYMGVAKTAEVQGRGLRSVS